jgi:hypothetical protein
VHQYPLARQQPQLAVQYSAELNPAERIFEYLRAQLANRMFVDVTALEAVVTQHLQSF